MEGMQKRKASPEPAPKGNRFYWLGTVTPTPYKVPRCDVVFDTEDGDVLRFWVKGTDSIAAVYSKIKEHMGFDVELYQTYKKKTYLINPNELVEDSEGFGMHMGCRVLVKRAAPVVEGEVHIEPTQSTKQSAKKQSTEQPAKKQSTKKAKKAEKAAAVDPADEADEPDEPESAGEGGSSSTAAPGKRRRSPPAWAPRGVPGGYFVAQLPRKKDEHGNPLGETEYQNVYWHQGM